MSKYRSDRRDHYEKVKFLCGHDEVVFFDRWNVYRRRYEAIKSPKYLEHLNASKAVKQGTARDIVKARGRLQRSQCSKCGGKAIVRV